MFYNFAWYVCLYDFCEPKTTGASPIILGDSSTNTFNDGRSNTQQFSKKNASYMDLLRKEIEANIQKYERKVWDPSEVQLLMELREVGLTWQKIAQRISKTNPQICRRKFYRELAAGTRWPKQIDERVKYLYQVESKSWCQIYDALTSQFGITQRKKLRDIKERYNHCLNSQISREQWTVQQDLKLIQCMKIMGRKWKKISHQFKGRNQLQIKNRYYGTLLPITRRVQRMTRSPKR